MRIRMNRRHRLKVQDHAKNRTCTFSATVSFTSFAFKFVISSCVCLLLRECGIGGIEILESQVLHIEQNACL